MHIYKSFNKVVVLILLGLMAFSPVAGETLEGRWSGRILRTEIKLRMTIRRDRNRFDDWEWGDYFEMDECIGLNDAGAKSFQIKRESGVVHFQGGFTGKRGSGTFTFEIDEGFKSFLKEKGFSGLDEKEFFYLVGL